MRVFVEGVRIGFEAGDSGLMPNLFTAAIYKRERERELVLPINGWQIFAYLEFIGYSRE